MPTEIWQFVCSLPSVEASSLGRVRINGGAPTFGYWAGTRFVFSRRGFGTYKVARLVCEAFHGEAPEGRPYCLHEDEDVRNNCPENLRWGTQKENLNYPKFLEYCRSRIGANNPYVKGTRRVNFAN